MAQSRLPDALVRNLAKALGCSLPEARQALAQLRRRGLLRVEAGRVVLPLAEGAVR